MRTFFLLIALFFSVGMVSAQNTRVDGNASTAVQGAAGEFSRQKRPKPLR